MGRGSWQHRSLRVVKQQQRCQKSKHRYINTYQYTIYIFIYILNLYCKSHLTATSDDFYRTCKLDLGNRQLLNFKAFFPCLYFRWWNENKMYCKEIFIILTLGVSNMAATVLHLVFITTRSFLWWSATNISFYWMWKLDLRRSLFNFKACFCFNIGCFKYGCNLLCIQYFFTVRSSLS